MVGALQAVGGGTFLAMSAVLGVRLLLLAHKNRAIPELLLAIAFLCGGTIGALLEAGASTQFEVLPGETVGRLIAIGKVFGIIGITANCVFSWWVFRRNTVWAPCLVGVVFAIQVIAYAGHAAAGSYTSGIIASDWFWVEFVARVASPTWLGLEAWSYHSQMRKRVQVGLAEPIVADRFRLWTIASITGLVFLATSVPPMILPADTPFIAADILVFGLAGVATACAYWLAFFPPAAYRRRVEARAAASA